MGKKDNLRILIIGNRGYIGRELLHEIKKQKIEYLAIDKEYQKGPRELSFNVRNLKPILETITTFKPNIILHGGTYSAADYQNSFFNSFSEDFQALSNILKALSKIKTCKLIYFSSSYVYSGLANDKATEETPLRPQHSFGVGKSFFEQFILRNHQNSVVFRLSSVFGQGFAKNPNTIFNFIKEAKKAGQIIIWGTGKRKIQYIYMKDVIRYAFEAFHFDPGIYNLGGDEYASIEEATKKIANFFKAKVIFLKNKPEGETLPFMANDKIKATLSNISFTPFFPALTEFLNSYE